MLNQTKMGFESVTVYQHIALCSRADEYSMKWEIHGKNKCSEKLSDQYGYLSKIYEHHAKGLEKLSSFSLYPKSKSAADLEIHAMQNRELRLFLAMYFRHFPPFLPIFRGSYLKNGWSDYLGVKTEVGQFFKPSHLAGMEFLQRFMLIR